MVYRKKEVGIQIEMEFQNECLNIASVADILKVSQATIRNWIKTGLISPINDIANGMVFDDKSIYKLKEDIAQGNIDRLNKRRNKKHISGNSIPFGYTSHKQIEKNIEPLLTDIQNICGDIDINISIYVLKVIVIEWITKENISKNAKDYIETIFSRLPHYDILPQNLISIKEIVLNYKIPYISGEDVLGFVYMSLLNLQTRKKEGIYFTPIIIVDQLISKSIPSKISDATVILDPCCGCGNFLIRICQYLKKFGNTNDNDISKILKAIEIDMISLNITKINLAMCLNIQNYSVIDDNIICADALTNREWPKANYIIGNPPWGSELSNYNQSDMARTYEMWSDSSTDSFSLFIEAGLKNLSDNGKLSFVLPEAILNVSKHKKIRNFILSNSEIEFVHLFTKKFTGVVTSVIAIGLCKGMNLCKNVHVIWDKQAKVISGEFFSEEIFNVLAESDNQAIIEYLESKNNFIYLKNQADFALGIVTGNNKLWLSSEYNEGREEILRGKEIGKFHIEPAKNFINFNSEQYQQVAPIKFYRAKEKILYRFISNSLVFAYDNKQRLTLNSCNILIPRIKGYSMKYILAVLNSSVAQFYFSNKYHTFKVLRSQLESIPIPKCTEDAQEEIVELVDKILNSTHKEKLYNTLDRRIYDLYDIDKEKSEVINKYIMEKGFTSI